MNKQRVLKYIETQHKNIEFITERISIQNEKDYSPYKIVSSTFKAKPHGVGRWDSYKPIMRSVSVEVKERQYKQFDIEIAENNIRLASKKL